MAVGRRGELCFRWNRKQEINHNGEGHTLTVVERPDDVVEFYAVWDLLDSQLQGFMDEAR